MLSQQKLNAMQQVRKEFQDIQNNPILNIGATVGLPNPTNIMEWDCSMTGPQDTPFAGGLFFLRIKFPDNYPEKPPEVSFITPIYHLNVNHKVPQNIGGESLGHVCISTLNWWNNTCNIRQVLTDIFALFYLSNPESPYGLDRADEFRKNEKLYNAKCQFFTQKYASPDISNQKQIYTQDWDFTFPQM